MIDPACGSGAFLLAAARRIGRELAKVRAGEDQPTPAAFRHAVRDVIQRCIFGVDLNPLATDLCKLALWIEGHCAGMPLSFLDHHIKRGNSLIGATRALVEAGVPDDAYKAVTGDDKGVAREVKKRNKQERELALKQGMVQRGLFDAGGASGPDLAGELRALDEAADDSVAAVRAKARRLVALRERANPDKVQFDLWTAAFFQPLTPANAPNVPTSKDVLDPKLGEIRAIHAEAMADEVGFFHWELEFPQVFAPQRHRGTEDGKEESLRLRTSVVNMSGFDVVLGNPPWERIKLQEQEHFVDVPEISQAANKSAREKMIAAWRGGDERQRARIAEFDAAKYRAEAESRFVRASERFPLTAVGDVNTYALFAEQVRTVLSPAGRAGIIVPTGIATDDSTKAFFGDLSTRQQLVSLYDFENREKIFAEVDSRYKFSLLTVGVTREPTQFIFFAANVTQLTDKQRVFTLTPEEITLINPNTRTAPVFRTRQDAELTKKIYRRAPVLVNELTEANPWGVHFMAMFHMSNDSHLFQSASGEGYLPLYEGKMVQAYNHRAASVVTNINNLKRPGQPDETTEAQLQDPRFQVNPQYTITQENLLEKLGGQKCQSGFIAYKSVSSVTNERSMIAAWLPPVAVAHSMNLILPDTKITSQISLLSVLNSVVLDYVIRQKMGGVNLSFFIINQLPVLLPSSFTPADIAYIVPRVVELVYTAWDIRAFAEDVWAEGDEALRAELLRRSAACNAGAPAELFSPREGFPLPPYRWDEGRRALARAELDARIARLYGLTRDELRYILDPADVYGPDFPGETFRVLKEKETKLYGEYRTRRMVLEAWDGGEVRS
ncbi:hypothetical protein K2Z83_21205 [Oscillochloris sp. ZM17-4]|uniref:Eco57I restriction-modification methylase domain-containing protein n=1 Tax=Oscillochloris sp. ZM17-4 TaxID=2866714 RepID=UPI001C73BC92|nr:hypothetical protein [Oscillochloris sp. ZM17-4]MBX0330191.1 hypothetical protein [Oscillochloris sp. ZM17-4]